MSLTFAFNPFTAPRFNNGHFSRKIHVPRIPFRRKCPLCGDSFETRDERKLFCCRKHKSLAFQLQYRKILAHRVKLAGDEFMELLRADPNLSHYHFPKSPRQLGTQDISASVKVVVVDGKERVQGAVWLERQIRKGRVNYGNKTVFETYQV